MLNKLAFRNAKRSMKDYLVYLITMAGIAALMFAFNTMVFSEDVLRLCSEAMVMGAMIGICTFFIVLIVAWLIRYMMRFMLEKRSREFGTYLLMGMKKRQVCNLYMKENTFMGVAAFALGLILGVFLQQILMSIFFHVFGISYQLKVEINGWCLLMTTCCYFGCYLLALWKNRKLFRRMSISDLMKMSQENEQTKQEKTALRKWLLPIAVVYLIVFFLLMFRGGYQVIPAILAIAGFIVALYWLYIGGAAFLSDSIRRKGRGIYKPGRLFLLRQLSSKLRTMRFTMGNLTVLFVCALLGGSAAMMFSDYQDQALKNSMPFDVIVTSQDPRERFEEERQAVAEAAAVTDELVYRIYENGTTDLNDYLYTHGSAISAKYRNEDGSVNREEVEKDGYEYYAYDTYMGLSDYNDLRKMLGYEPVELEEGHYLIHIKERMVKDLAEWRQEGALTVGNETLMLSEIRSEPFGQNGNNGADYLLVVPDVYLADMEPFYSNYAAALEKNSTVGLQATLVDIVGRKAWGVSYEEFNALQDEGKIGDDAWYTTASPKGGGTDQMIVVSGDVLVAGEEGMEMRFVVSSVIFPLAYIGLVFLCVAMTILAVQQLSDSNKYRFRYEVLRKLGLSRRQINGMILKQLSMYYLLPVLVAVVLSAIIGIQAGTQFIRYTGAHSNGVFYFGMSLLVFLGVYLIYFAATYIGFCRNVRREM